MPDSGDFDDDEADSFDEQPGPDEEQVSTAPCPYCRQPIYEDAERCPYCERYVSDEDAPAGRKPWWIVAGALVCLYVVLRWIVG